MEKNMIFLKFKDGDFKDGRYTGQKTEIIECDIKTAHELFDLEREKIEKGNSDWDYFDITNLRGALLRSFNNRTI